MFHPPFVQKKGAFMLPMMLRVGMREEIKRNMRRSSGI